MNDSSQLILKQKAAKGCLSLFNYFIDMSPTHMSPFFVEKTCLFPSKTYFFNKKWTHMGGAHIYV